ncbi:7956_t:CDS:2, partial [Cetraspora pellucida]
CTQSTSYPPPGYVPVRTPARKLMATPTPMGGDGYDLPAEIPGVGNLPFFKQKDMQHFGKLLEGKYESELSVDELKERNVIRLLLKMNGTTSMKKMALRKITVKARDSGASPLFNQIFPLLMSQNLEDQERLLLILVVIEPLLIDEDDPMDEIQRHFLDAAKIIETLSTISQTHPIFV